MTLACPACGKHHADAPPERCDRCGCDLSRLHAVLDAARVSMVRARASLGCGDWAAALDWAARSWDLSRGAASAHVACLAAAALGDADALAQWRRRVLNAGG